MNYNEQSESLIYTLDRQTQAIQMAHSTLVGLVETLDGHLALLELLSDEGEKPRQLVQKMLVVSDMETVRESIGEVTTTMRMIEKAYRL